MTKNWIQMGMSIEVTVLDNTGRSSNEKTKEKMKQSIQKIFEYFEYVDQKFSTYKDGSEIMMINKKVQYLSESSADMKEIFTRAEMTKEVTGGFFDIERPDGSYDPSGLVKGWAIKNATDILHKDGWENFYLNVGGDISVSGHNVDGDAWSIGIRNPFNPSQIVKTIYLSNGGVATSGHYERGTHIYNPMTKRPVVEGVASITVIGPDIYEADRFATAAFAMGKRGIDFIEYLPNLEGYMIMDNKTAVMTSRFHNYLISPTVDIRKNTKSYA